MAEETATIPIADIDVLVGKREAPRLEALLFAIFADTGKTNFATIAGILSRIYIDVEKRATGRFYVYIKTAHTTDGLIELKVTDPRGRQAATATAVVDPSQLTEKDQSVQLVMPLTLTLGPEGVEGPFWFEVFYKEQSLGGTVLFVQFPKKEN